jgi:23S rRNA (cytosine1962-C5)-methyltransferase
LPWVLREEILRMDGTPPAGEPVHLVDEEGRSLGLGDIDLTSSRAIRRLGLPEERGEGVIPRQLRRAIERRARMVHNPRFCRLANDDGDGLPGLVVDRYGDHFVIQTSTRAMDARTDEIARSLAEVAGAQTVLLRNDSHRREAVGLPRQRAQVLLGRPPRWTRVQELGARFTVDLYQGAGTGYFYDQRQIRRLVAQLAPGARVLDACCYVGGLFIHAGLNGATEMQAYDNDVESVRLARENVEANGLMGRAHVVAADAFDALEALADPYDLVLLDSPDFPAREADASFTQLLRLAVRHTRHGGRLIVTAYSPPLPAGPAALDERLVRACELEDKVAVRLGRPGLPSDFPTALGSPGAEYMSAVALEVS